MLRSKKVASTGMECREGMIMKDIREQQNNSPKCYGFLRCYITFIRAFAYHRVKVNNKPTVLTGGLDFFEK